MNESLTPLERRLLAACKEAYANLKGLDVPGEDYEAEINRILRLAIRAAEKNQTTK